MSILDPPPGLYQSGLPGNKHPLVSQQHTLIFHSEPVSAAQLCPMTSHPRTQAEGEAIWNMLSSWKSEKSERAGENLEWPLQLLLQHVWPPHRRRATISGREVDATPQEALRPWVRAPEAWMDSFQEGGMESQKH